MLQILRTAADLPACGTVHEYLRIEFKRRIDTMKPRELAKDVGAFANSVGGTILVGAARDGDRLGSYDPMTTDESQDAGRAFDLAVRDLCSPKPLVELHEIAKDGGFVLAVNVWAFPAQPVGVAVDGKSVATSSHFFFPYRSGAHVVALLPEHLPMMMLPDVRRTAILLSQIPTVERSNVVLQGVPSTPGAMVPFKMRARLDLDPEALTMRNTVHFTNLDSNTNIAIPADTITRVWQSSGAQWTVAARVTVKSEGRSMVVTPWD
jgi:hypothetical protein